MAGDWLKMDSSTPDKPEVLAITARMGWDDPDLTVGKLFRVWRWFDQQTIDGNAPGVTSALLDRIAGVTGFADAMRMVGWLVVDDAGLSLPKFDRHNGATAKARAQTAKRVASHRGNAEANAACNGASVTGALAREEKRREEKYPPTPLDEIVELYHAKLPSLPRVLLKTEKRSKACRDFWRWIFDSRKSDGEPRAQTADQALTWVAGYFERAAANDFLLGKQSGRGHDSWRADFDFLLTERGRKHVIERTVEA